MARRTAAGPCSPTPVARGDADNVDRAMRGARLADMLATSGGFGQSGAGGVQLAAIRGVLDGFDQG